MKTNNRPSLIFIKKDAADSASRLLAFLRAGGSSSVDDLEVIDEVLRQATPDDRVKFDLFCGNRKMIEWDMCERVRFERGLDVRG